VLEWTQTITGREAREALNLEAVRDAEYLEISKIEDYDVLMEHCGRGLAG
jgi:hypothetical protein